MDPTTLRSTLLDLLPLADVASFGRQFGAVQRSRKLDLRALVISLVLAEGTDDTGRQADVRSRYLDEAGQGVVRSSFYDWFNWGLAMLMAHLTHRAIEQVQKDTPFIPGGLQGVRDWLLMDSETVILPDELAETFPATSTPAGLKIHKVFSLGRNNVVDFKITPAREHDGPHLVIDESWRGYGLIVDLGYASLKLLRDCQRFGVHLVIRLKDGWKPAMLAVVDEDGTLVQLDGRRPAEDLLAIDPDELDGSNFDFDVGFGRGADRVNVRMIGVPGDSKMHWCLTTLPRRTHSPDHVAQLYRTRWEEEIDNKRDKAGARLDQIRAEKVESVLVLIHASLLKTILVNRLVWQDLANRPPTRAPLHGLALSYALTQSAGRIMEAIAEDRPHQWSKLEAVLRARAHDPNWRRRPSPVDRLRGTTAPPGRPRSKRLAECNAAAAAYRQEAA